MADKRRTPDPSLVRMAEKVQAMLGHQGLGVTVEGSPYDVGYWMRVAGLPSPRLRWLPPWSSKEMVTWWDNADLELCHLGDASGEVGPEDAVQEVPPDVR